MIIFMIMRIYSSAKKLEGQWKLKCLPILLLAI